MSSNEGKRDFRKGNSASVRTAQAKNAIREVLSHEEATFKVIMMKTGLSRPALASNLKWLHKRRQVEQRIDPEDRRVKYYSLNDDGRKQHAIQNYMEKVETIDTMSVVEAMGMLKESVAFMLTLATSPPIIEVKHGEITITDDKTHESQNVPIICTGKVDDATVPALSEKARNILTNCLDSFVDCLTVDDKPALLVDTLKDLLESVNMVATSKNVDVERLKRLPNLTFTFRFNRDNLIRQYELLKDSEEFRRALE